MGEAKKSLKLTNICIGNDIYTRNDKKYCIFLATEDGNKRQQKMTATLKPIVKEGNENSY
jgi:hypothetical protein